MSKLMLAGFCVTSSNGVRRSLQCSMANGRKEWSWGRRSPTWSAQFGVVKLAAFLRLIESDMAIPSAETSWSRWRVSLPADGGKQPPRRGGIGWIPPSRIHSTRWRSFWVGFSEQFCILSLLLCSMLEMFWQFKDDLVPFCLWRLWGCFLIKITQVAVAVEIEIGTVNGMQKLRNDVLNEHFELELNEKLLTSKHGTCQLCLDKTHFCEEYESQLLQQSTLTEHQRLTYERMQKSKSPFLHLSAVAGSGKTFVAVQMVIETLKNSAGQVLFVAPSLPLCYYFIRWLGRRWMHEEIFLESLLDRVGIFTPDTNFMNLAVQEEDVLLAGQAANCPSPNLISRSWMKRMTYSSLMFWRVVSWAKSIQKDGFCCPICHKRQFSNQPSQRIWLKKGWQRSCVAQNA